MGKTLFESHLEILNHGRVHKFSIGKAENRLRYIDVLSLWQCDPNFRSFFIGLLAEAPFSAFRWETPAVTARTVDRQFEFVILDSPGLDISPDPSDFAEHFNSVDGDVITFPNLGGDAFLVVPCPLGSESAYGHLGMFTRQGSKEQNHALWCKVGQAVEQQLSNQPLWLSTAGGGVPWLHVRLDSRPKYYGFQAYREFL